MKRKTSSSRLLSTLTPEKKVESEVLAWAFQNGFHLDVFDSRAVYSPAAKVYRQTQALPIGCSDLIGVGPQGIAVFLELKAPGKETVCRLEQYQFLRSKIERGAFGLVVSSVPVLSESWANFLDLRLKGGSQDYLLGLLPKKVLAFGKTVSAESFLPQERK